METTALDYIRTLPLFSGLTEEEKDRLIETGRVRSFAGGQRLFLLGDEVYNFYVLCDGSVQLFRETPDGHELTADVLIRGDTVGELEILQEQPSYQFNAAAVKDTVAVEFPLPWLKENTQRYGTFALNLLAALSRRSHRAAVEAEHKSTMSAPQQVACFLQRLCVLHGLDPQGFDLPYSKTLIASRLGIELETFSRTLEKLRLQGCIRVEGARVSIEDIGKLNTFVCRSCSLLGNCREHEELAHKMASIGSC